MYNLQGGASKLGYTSMHQRLYYNTKKKLPEDGYTHLIVAIEVHRRTKRAHGLLTMRTLQGQEADNLQAFKGQCIHVNH